MEVRSKNLKRYEIDTGNLLEAVFRSYRLSIERLAPVGLWRVGRGKIADRSREVYFVRSCERGAMSTVCDVLGSHAKCCVFAPTRASSRTLSRQLSCVVIGLEDVIDWQWSARQKLIQML